LIDTGTAPPARVYPSGLWLLVRDCRRPPGLLAPSTTPLPAGSPDRIAIPFLRPAHGNGLGRGPQVVIDSAYGRHRRSALDD